MWGHIFLFLKWTKIAWLCPFKAGVGCLPSLPDQTTALMPWDAIVILQALVRVANRFSEVAEMVMIRILVEVWEAASRIASERNRQGRDGQFEFNITNGQNSYPRQRRGKEVHDERKLTKPFSWTSLYVSGQQIHPTHRRSETTPLLSLMETTTRRSLLQRV